MEQSRWQSLLQQGQRVKLTLEDDLLAPQVRAGESVPVVKAEVESLRPQDVVVCVVPGEGPAIFRVQRVRRRPVVEEIQLVRRTGITVKVRPDAVLGKVSDGRLRPPSPWAAFVQWLKRRLKPQQEATSARQRAIQADLARCEEELTVRAARSRIYQ